MSEMTEASSSEKEPLTCSVMYLDRVRSEMRLKLETIYWELEYKNLKYDSSCFRYDPSMGSLIFTKLRESATVILYPNFSCEMSMLQCFVVYELETHNRKYSESVFAENTGDRKYKMELPAPLIDDKSNKYLKKSGFIVLGIRYNSRRLLNTEVGVYLIKSDKTDNFLEAYRKRLFTDFIIRADGQEFHVHKAILSARSIHIFRNVPSKESEIVLDAKATTVQNVIHYLYSGELPTVTLDEMIDVFVVSFILHIPSLVDLCVVYFLDILNERNVVQIRYVAKRTRNGLLIKAVNEMALSILREFLILE